ncbi:MAG: recF [Dehalococcoidia bacterium]|nr:recF [Dehalococcoidia bacterium]
MHLTHLNLQNFRNFIDLDLDLVSGVTVVFGGNGQGKTNLLEAASILATVKSLRAGSERELINWDSERIDEIPFVRVRGNVSRASGPIQLEVVVQLVKGSDEGSQLQKRGRLNGVVKRASDLVGQANAVLFAPQDIELVHGSPSLRRQYLNIMLSQAGGPMLRELQRYTKVLTQRNSLLKAIRERAANSHELDFWDSELVESGAFITQQRAEAMGSLQGLSRQIHRELTGGQEELTLTYHPSVPTAHGADVREAFRLALASARKRESALGASLVGPHRDDFAFYLAGRDMGIFSSRGQQRTASLALKLAEAQYLRERTGESPILLLDDVFSELDAQRRSYLVSWIAGWEQALLTTAEPEQIERRLLPNAVMLEVVGGRVSVRG